MLCLSFYCSTMLHFFSQSEAVTVSHFSLWPSLLKKVSLVAMHTVGCMFHRFASKSKARTVSCSIDNVLKFGCDYIIICINTVFVPFEKLCYPWFILNLTHIRYNVSEVNYTTFRNCLKLLNDSTFVETL